MVRNGAAAAGGLDAVLQPVSVTKTLYAIEGWTGTVSMGGGNPAAPAMGLVFPGRRPGRADLASLGAAGSDGINFSLTDARGEDGAAEIIAMGLAFDIYGLAGQEAANLDPEGPRLGLPQLPVGEAITIQPAPNIRTVPMMLPVLRVLAGLAARIATAGAAALRWEPAGLWVDPAYFIRTADAWLAGGAFPAPGLVSFERQGLTLRSRGLAALTGQELSMRGDASTDSLAARAVRLVHLLAEAEPLRTTRAVRLPDGLEMVLRPSADGCSVEAE
jgi:hypothetical protein